MFETLVVAAVVLLVAGGIAAAITAVFLHRWRRAVLAGGGFAVHPLAAEQVDEFLADRGVFAVTATREFTAPAAKVWDALQLDGGFSWLPLITGIRYRDGSRSVGAMRSFDAPLFAVQERVVTHTPHTRLTVTGTRISIPVLVSGFAQDYRLTEHDGRTTLAWTIAVRPRVGGFLPLRWGAPFARPFAAWAIKGLGTRI
ncbi:SRPBCC family protein [Nocardia sp. NPDC005978]|uniref:SRPBCC family protein n=1 Tax=Nocardia sp. NPDC005978 TaxID=3156725 RepID=UPI0033B43C2D